MDHEGPCDHEYNLDDIFEADDLDPELDESRADYEVEETNKKVVPEETGEANA